MFRYNGPVVEGGKETLAIFASESGIDLLRKATVIAVDGMFTTCPVPYYQLFILQAQIGDGASYPVVFGLLPNKCAATYLKFFKEVAGLAEDMFKSKHFLNCVFLIINITEFSFFMKSFPNESVFKIETKLIL